MDHAEEVTNPTSKEALELAAAAAKPAEEAEKKPVEGKEEKPAEHPAEKPAEGKEGEEQKPDDEKPEEESSTIRQMRKQIRAQQKIIAQIQSAQNKPTPEPRPQRDSFESDDQYVQAEVAFQLRQAQSAPAQVPTGISAKASEIREVHQDFDEALHDIDHVVFSHDSQQVLNQAVETLKYGGDVLYHIAKNPEIAEELSILPPAIMATRLGEIHAEIRQTKTAPKPKPVSKAPAPANPEKGISQPEKSYDDCKDQGEFTAMRRKEKEAARKARYGF